MGLEIGSFVEDLVPENPVPGDFVSQGDDHLRLIKSAVKSTFPGLAGRVWRHVQHGISYTALTTDAMSVIASSAALALALSPAATLGNGWLCMLHAASGDITVDPNGSETVNGVATAVILNTRFGILLCNGTSFSLWEARIPATGGSGTITAADVAFVPAGNISSTNVQAAIQELDTEKAPLASPVLTGNPTAPTPATADNDTSIATTAYVAARIANDAPTKTGGGASGTWDISITGNAATASVATTVTTLPAIHLGGSIRPGTGVDALTGLTDSDSFIIGITVDIYGRVTVLRHASSPDGSSLHPDSQIMMSNNSKKWLRDIRIGDNLRTREGSALVTGIWTNVLGERPFCEVNGVVCTPGHLFITPTGWGAVDPESYRKGSYQKNRTVKGAGGVIETFCEIADPNNVETLVPGTSEILSVNGTFIVVSTIRHFHTVGANGKFPVWQDAIALLLSAGNNFFADNYAVSTFA